MPKTGDFFVTATGGWVAKVIRLVTHSPVNHAGVYIGFGQVIEAQPHGAQDVPADRYPNALWSRVELTDAQRKAIENAATRYIGTPYNFVDIGVLLLVHGFGWTVPRWIRRRVSTSSRMICSQLVDQCYLDAGVHLFKDGRPQGDVTPEDLRRFCR